MPPVAPDPAPDAVVAGAPAGMITELPAIAIGALVEVGSCNR
jgi:hypothetical protein